MNPNILYYGSPQPPVKKHDLKSGYLSLVYQNGFIRRICIGGKEVVNMIYFAVRDHHWGTFHGTIKNEKIKETSKGFEITYRAVISERSIQYVFDCMIKGNSEGRIEFQIRGESFSGFRSNRIGFCILHSVNEYAGKPCIIRSADKTEINGKFPVLPEPHQPFINIRSILWEPHIGWESELKFEGDIFEMEDQRNWSDGSYKTYCTPLSNPFPVEVKMGDKIKQRVILSVNALRKDAPSKIKNKPAAELTVAKGPPVNFLPGIGICDSSIYGAYSDNDQRLLRALGLHHLMIEFDISEPGFEELIGKIITKTSPLELPFMISLLFGNQPDLEVSKFIDIASKLKLRIDSIVVLSKDSMLTTNDLINIVVSPLRLAYPGIRIGGGSGQHFAELNRNRISPDNIDFLTFPSTPQAHLIDPVIMIENLAGSAGALKGASAFSSGKPVYISPITLRSRYRQKSGDSGVIFDNNIPPDVDQLQSSMFAAGWTLGSIKNLAEAGAGQLTYFELTGWKGIIQGQSPSPQPSFFYAQANAAFPVYFLFYWIGKLAGAGLIPVTSSDPRMVSGLALSKEKNKYLLIANHTDMALDLPVTNFKKGNPISRLNEKNVSSFMNDPLSFFDKSKEETFEGRIQLMPFELVVLKS